MSYLFSLCSSRAAGQNYANRCRNPNAVILRFVFQKYFYLSLNVWPDPDFWSVPPFSLLLQDLGNRYTLNSIYKDESQCPAVQYKCRRGGRGRPLVWQRQDSDTFKGRDDTWWHGHYYKKWQGRENADHLLHFRPLNCSFNCSNLQFKCLKRSLLSLHFHCNHKMYDDRMTKLQGISNIWNMFCFRVSGSSAVM